MERYLREHSITNVEHTKLLPSEVSPQHDMFELPHAA